MLLTRPFLGSMVLALALISTAATASAQAPLIATFGGALGYGTGGTLPGNDDGYTDEINLTAAFPGGVRFFGGPYTTFFVNNNGNITFSAGVGQFTPTPFPVAARPMIAPYWGDVDTRGGGTPARNYVAWHLQPGLLAVTWHNVGYYSSHDDRQMDFQMILRNALDCGSGDFDVEFRYNVCGWTTGDASGGSGGFGGTPAQAGFDAGNGMDFVEIPGSRTPTIHTTLCTGSNVGEPGIWRFSVRGGTVVCPGAGEPCAGSGVGACSLGLTACIGREVQCVPVGSSSPETCDNIDNDCNGTTDEGDLCGAGSVCVNGACVAPCFEGACREGETCTASGACAETACIDVVCEAGARCEAGVCLDGCGGITCPHGQQCFAGRCTDLCDILTCTDDEVCVEGECVPQCPCRSCESDEICGGDGVCTPIGCDLTICDPGFYCDGGTCFDACDGAVCPRNQHCEIGRCVADSMTPDAGMPTPDGGGGGENDGGGGIDAGAGEIDGGRGPRPRTGDCGCAVGRSELPMAWIGLGAALFAVIGRRRRGAR